MVMDTMQKFFLKVFRRLNRIFHFVDGGRNLMSLKSPPILYGQENQFSLIRDVSNLRLASQNNFSEDLKPVIYEEVIASTFSGHIYKLVNSKYFYIPESDYRHPYQALWSSRRPISKPKIQITDTCIIVPKRSGNYYHFLVEELPDIIEELRCKPIQVFVHHDSPNFVFEFLKCITNYHLISEEFLFCSSIIKMPKISSVISDIESKRLQNLRQYSTFIPQVSVKSNYIFILRDVGDNFELEVSKEFERNGFTIVLLHKIPVLHQVAFFKTAKIVVGFHGAGLSNIVFCQDSNCQVWELSIKNLNNQHFLRTLAGSCYEPLARQLRLNYRFIQIDPQKSLSEEISSLVNE